MTIGQDLADAIAAAIAAVRGAMASPADQFRALLVLAAMPGDGPVASQARRTAAIALASATRAYQPANYDDAVQIMSQVAAVLDSEALAAADAGQDDTYLSLSALRAAVIADLAARGADLAPLVDVHRAVALPSLVLAQQLWADASRADELVASAEPIHPAFMPVSFRAAAR